MRFPFLLGRVFVEAQQRVTRLRSRQFTYTFIGTFIAERCHGPGLLE